MNNSIRNPWFDTISGKDFGPLRQRESETDVVVVGAGIAGLTAALLLKQAGRKVLVIEKGMVGAGETGNTTAHLTEILDRRYYELISKFGKRGASKAAESSRAAIDRIEQWVIDLDIECGFKRLPAYLYTEKKGDIKELNREYKAMRGLGVQASLLDAAPLPFPTAGAIRVEDQAQFHPLKYLRAIAERIPGEGSAIHERTQVLKIERGRVCEVITDRGTIRASSVISAADAPSASAWLLQTLVYPYRTYAIGAKIVRPVQLNGLFYDTADPYHYIRMQDDVLIVGGEDHRVGMKKDTDESFSALESYTRERFDVSAMPYRWSGQVMEPADGLPYIGRTPLSKNVQVATGFAGNGMTFGTLSGMILADAVLRRKNPWASLYSTHRIKPLASARRFVTENADFPKCLIQDWTAGGEVSSLAEVPRGEGRILRKGAKPFAVYRDAEGTVQSVSAVCPHMGCLVRFNQAERSWDCPCHGSRFATDGSLLHGPALKNLTKVEFDEEKGASEEDSKSDQEEKAA